MVITAAAVEEPDIADALATARRLFEARQLQQAEDVCRRLLKAHPANSKALHQLGQITLHSGAAGLAVALVSRAIALGPAEPAFYRTLGTALRQRGQAAEAEKALRRALDTSPESAELLAGLGLALMDQVKLADAVHVLEQAVARHPDSSHLHHVLGVVQVVGGNPGGAIASFRRATQLDPISSDAHAGVLFAQHYVPRDDPEALSAEAIAWARRHAEPLTARAAAHVNHADPDRRLRIGYISGDLRGHPVGRILAAVLPLHDTAQVEVVCYSNHWAADNVTAHLRAAAHRWQPVAHLSDEAAADLIRADQIDVLVDLSGHTGANRLLVLARKPAPVQAMWLGYFDTTGMTAVDYIVADKVVCPRGDERLYVERVARLPQSFLCYGAPDPSPDVSPLPARSAGHVTFGCLNNVSKITSQVIAVWAEILRAVPGSRLCLKSVPLADAGVRARFSDLFVQNGITADRLSLHGPSSYADHLASYSQIDIALDSFPYNGGATTMDALWMGVPVVSLRGDHFVSRMGASVLTAVGHQELIADSRAAYVAKAVALARDLDNLAERRAALRQQTRDSALCNGPAFARGLEATYRRMWRTWCRSRKRG